jgi:hypothetical protein
MNFKALFSVSLFISTMPSLAIAKDVVWFNGHDNVTYSVQDKKSPVVDIALKMFSSDIHAVTGMKAKEKAEGTIKVFQLDMLNDKEFEKLSSLNIPINKFITLQDAFFIGVRNGNIVVAGSNGRGTAYGILELSRMAGVSPWIWWGDVTPKKQNHLAMDDRFTTIQSPSVEYRGIFINDEDWSLRPWSHTMIDRDLPEGAIGPRTYKKIFELLLRLRGNAIWPAMHTGTTAFFKVKGNKEVADSCDIFVGSSHCEPLLRNNVDEWDVNKRGDYNYITNKGSVQNYWTERLMETKGMDAIYTIGMRGIHDGSMEGVNTLKEKTEALQKVIHDQRKLLGKFINKDVKKIPQVFIPYKEVLQIYENGLHVPDDVTLMWCDDNYGYMTRLSDKEQQKRSGGGGVYYHLSYWGRPHDYLWLTTLQPGLIYNEMKTAYDYNARKMWIVNVHDPKVAAYDLSLFMDMAWNINSVQPNSIQKHLENWLCQQFGYETGTKLLPVMTEYFHLTAIRKPEFMGWSQTELDKKKYDRGLSPASNTEFNSLEFGNELDRYLDSYENLKKSIDEIEKTVSPELKDAYFSAIKYPVYAAAAMATKQLEAQEARELARTESFHHDAEALTSAVRSVKAYREIEQLTNYYNNSMANGKWKNSMCMNPRNLPVFGEPNLPDKLSEQEIAKYSKADSIASTLDIDDCTVFNACNYSSASTGAQPIEMLGHSMKAVAMPKDGTLTYKFDALKNGEAILRTAVIPTQANDKGDIRFSVSIDDAEPTVYSIKEPYRSERWKLNVLRGQAVRELKLNITQGSHTLVIKALDDHIIVDQWMLDFDTNREFYVFPIKPAI